MQHAKMVRTYHDNGKLHMEKSYRDGKLDGEIKTWYENGQLYERGFYQNGKRVGRFRTWDLKGKPWTATIYQDMKEECKVWYENGHLYLKANYHFSTHPDHEANGERQSWYENGEIHEHRFYQNGDLVDDKFTSTKKRSFLRIIRCFRKHMIDLINNTIIPDLANIISRL